MLGPTYFHILAQLSLFPFMGNGDSFLSRRLNTIGCRKLNNQERPHTVYHETAKMTEDIQSVIIYSACGPRMHKHDKLALENTEQAGPLDLCTKAH